jgi:hypothetical protein
MRYQTRIAGDAVEVTSAHTGTVYTYKIPPGTSLDAYALRSAERARVSECLATVLAGGHREGGRGGRHLHIPRRSRGAHIG